MILRRVKAHVAKEDWFAVFIDMGLNFERPKQGGNFSHPMLYFG